MNTTPDDLYYKMVTTVRSDYPLNIDERILYEVFNVTYVFFVERRKLIRDKLKEIFEI